MGKAAVRPLFCCSDIDCNVPYYAARLTPLSLPFGINMFEIIGWLSSLVLLMTLVKQVYKQWKDGSSENISKWLFTGQLASSIGFTAYSVHTGNWVFVVTNALLTLNNIFGIFVYYHFKRKAART